MWEGSDAARDAFWPPGRAALHALHALRAIPPLAPILLREIENLAYFAASRTSVSVVGQSMHWSVMDLP